MRVTLSQVREGSIVKVRGDFGQGPAKRARVDSVDDNIKNGRPGIDYTVLSDGDSRWAYLEQVLEVEQF
jgi:hypothetical protein